MSDTKSKRKPFVQYNRTLDIGERLSYLRKSAFASGPISVQRIVNDIYKRTERPIPDSTYRGYEDGYPPAIQVYLYWYKTYRISLKWLIAGEGSQIDENASMSKEAYLRDIERQIRDLPGSDRIAVLNYITEIPRIPYKSDDKSPKSTYIEFNRTFDIAERLKYLRNSAFTSGPITVDQIVDGILEQTERPIPPNTYRGYEAGYPPAVQVYLYWYRTYGISIRWLITGEDSHFDEDASISKEDYLRDIARQIQDLPDQDKVVALNHLTDTPRIR